MIALVLALGLCFPRAPAIAGGVDPNGIAGAIDPNGIESVVDPNAVDRVARSRYWRLLLHDRSGWFGSRSEADGPDFFLSQEGKRDPKAELLADVAAFRDPLARRLGPLAQHPACAFPERLRFLNEELKLGLAKPECPDFDRWIARFDPAGLTLVFASAFLSNPASAFGHTFLRVDSRPAPGQATKNDLLDYGVNFSANTENDNQVYLVLRGLSGSYLGTYGLSPYFEKVNEYVSSESRDLWEYRLPVDREAVLRMLAHVWELGTTHFDYFFLDENCSYHLLALIEVARPDWELSRRFPFWVIPADTIRAVADGIDLAPTFRPSLRRQAIARIGRLSTSERERFRAWREGEREPSGDESAPLLDAFLDFEKFRLYEARREPAPGDEALRRKLLIARARAPVAADAVTPGQLDSRALERERPDRGHGSAKASIGAGWLRGEPAGILELRPAYHDLLDPPEGHARLGEIQFARVRLELAAFSGRLRLRSLDLSRVLSIAPWDELSRPLSWSALATLDRPAEAGPGDLALRVGAGLGSAWRLGDRLVGYALARAEAGLSSGFRYGARVGPGAELGLLADVATHHRALLSLDLGWFPTESPGARGRVASGLAWAWSPARDLELRASVHAAAGPRGGVEPGLAFSRYF